jgi:predicted ATPase
MTTSEVSNENGVTTLFNDVPEEVHKAFEERKKARAEEMQELLACYAKDRHDCHANQGACSSSDQLCKRGTHSKGIASVYLSYPRGCLRYVFQACKLTRNIVGDEVAKVLAKFSQNSKYQPTTFATTHPTTPSSSVTPSTSATRPSYGMPLNHSGKHLQPTTLP